MDNSLIYTLTDSLEPPKSLLEAATEGDLDRVKAMVARGANVNLQDQFGASALHYASQQGHKEVAELLIVKGARVDAGRITSLHYAAESGHKDMIELLIVKGADVNAKNAAGQTPLHYAAENGRKDIVEMLIANEADVNAKNNNGQTPVDIALDQNYKDIVELLLEKGTELSIYVTAYLGDIDKVKSFIETGTSVNGDPGRGHRTPLYWAVRNDHKDVAKLLIEKGADVSSVSLLYYVCMHGHRDLAEFLIQKGADANSKNWGDTPSHYAVWGGHVDVLELLLAYGADANAKGSAAGSLLYYAAGSGSTDMTRLLLNKSADVNIKENEGGQTPLHRAAGKGHTTVAELLITNGADVNAKDNQGRTPLHYAQENGHTKIAELLRKSTANLESSSEPRHDVAITGVSALSRVPKDYTVPVVVNIENQGDFSESFEVTLIDVTDGKEIGSKSVTLSAAGREGMDETFDSTLTGPTKPGPNEPYTQYGNYLWFGDVNGDGYDDLLVAGASRWNQCQGRAYLYYGGQNMDEKADNTFTGEAIDNYFGEGAALVDVNGDGFDDVILGAWKYNNAQGRVYIYHGSPDMDENADLILDGREGTNDRFGNKICAGDVNNDGYDDLFVNALGWNKRTGRVYLYYGGDPMDTTADLIFNGENEGDIFGCTIDDPKMIGDVNGDGYGDLLITTRFWKAGSGQGRAYLYYGGEGTSMDSIPDKVLTGENGHDEFAVSSCIFDIDNDGFDDVIIGARRWNRNQGRVYVFWGAEDMDLNADLIIDGEPGARAALGGATIDAGYVNNDRYGDILVAAYNYYRGSHTGRAYLFYGDTKASINTGCDKTFTLPKDTRNSPQHVALGDLNNDSYPEVAIGGWRYNKGQGRVWIYYNNPPSSTEVKLDWDTTRANIGEHTLKAIVSPIRGEKDIADNTVTVTIEVKEPSK